MPGRCRSTCSQGSASGPRRPEQTPSSLGQLSRVVEYSDSDGAREQISSGPEATCARSPEQGHGFLLGRPCPAPAGASGCATQSPRPHRPLGRPWSGPGLLRAERSRPRCWSTTLLRSKELGRPLQAKGLDMLSCDMPGPASAGAHAAHSVFGAGMPKLWACTNRGIA